MEQLKQLNYRDRPRALREIGQLSRALPQQIHHHFDLLVSGSADAETALHSFARFFEAQPAAFTQLAQSVFSIRCLLAVFTHSAYLAEEILQRPHWITELLEEKDLWRMRNAEQMQDALLQILPPGVPTPVELARFRRRQTLRILLRDVLGIATLPEVTNELTALADCLVDVTCQRLAEKLTETHGAPGDAARFSVIALGKMGGNELNFSSDIDLMYLYSANGTTAGPACIPNQEFFTRLARQLTDLLSAPSAEGNCYRVDLRLRPDGSTGELCISLEGARAYYGGRARDWELQMMIKARVAAGDRATGQELLDFVEPLTYKTTLDFSSIEALSLTRERINEKLAARNVRRGAAASIDVKLAPGGIRDIEFLVQCLQRLHGGGERWVRHGGTMLALARLYDHRLLLDAEYGRLASAYRFLRNVEHRLQCADDRQTHTMPDTKEGRDLLARQMPEGLNAEWLMAETYAHFANVREIYERVVHTQNLPAETEAGDNRLRPTIRALEQTAPRVATALAQGLLRRAYRTFEHFLERLPAERLQTLNADSVMLTNLFDLFEHSPHFAEELIRVPEWMDELAQAKEPFSPTPATPRDLRRWYRRMMVRIQSASIAMREPVFETLARTSDLADQVIAAIYRIAVREVMASSPQLTSYEPGGQMWVVALGRLGMREFDLGSDADLVFVLADTDAQQIEFWTRVAQRVVDMIMAYTGDGVLFAVDTRLRPNGQAGALVATEKSFKEYFAQEAEPWEWITYMKSRTIAGDTERGENFLHQLQQIDWQRHGRSGRSRLELRNMRMRLEREQAIAHPLKSGRGGYYDIDFMLMYLRLKDAGVYFKVLNTPQRIEVLLNMGKIDKGLASMLRETATFYRALDHGMRVMNGYASDKLPQAQAQTEMLEELLKRWTPIPLHEVEQIRSSTRAAFERMFG